MTDIVDGHGADRPPLLCEQLTTSRECRVVSLLEYWNGAHESTTPDVYLTIRAAAIGRLPGYDAHAGDAANRLRYPCRDPIAVEMPSCI